MSKAPTLASPVGAGLVFQLPAIGLARAVKDGPNPWVPAPISENKMKLLVLAWPL